MVAIKVWFDGSIGVCEYNAEGALMGYSNANGTINQMVNHWVNKGYKVLYKDAFIVTMVQG